MPIPDEPLIHALIEKYDVNKNEISMVYMSPYLYCHYHAFEEDLNLRNFVTTNHPTAGLFNIQ